MNNSWVPPTVYEKIKTKVNDFAEHESYFGSESYSETDVRRDFIDPLFEALGWDVLHQNQRNPLEREVRVERPQQQVGATSQRRADYAFFLAPDFRDERFFVEAKRPKAQIASDADAHFQTIRYGWNAGTPICVLTNFREFIVLDCRFEPDIDTCTSRVAKSPDGFVYAFNYKDFLDQEKLSRVYWIFSREAVSSGAYERFAAALPQPKGKSRQLAMLRTGDRQVDESFLAELEERRAAMASAFKSANESLSGEQLTEITQRTLDRLVFLRFLEDKLIETRYSVANFLKDSAQDRWTKFRAACRQLDATYNGIVYKLHPILDDPNFSPEPEAFADTIQWLSHTNSKYLFNYVPVHILGSIYERFLGTQIIATKHEAYPEQKPEIREQGGVYYTPEHIVQYIVKNTVGKLIQGKTPDTIATMRFADIACGSGSFLIAVYDYLIRYHEEYYNAHPAEAVVATKKAIISSRKRLLKEKIFDCVDRDGVLRLTLEKKRAILLNNVFGIDIDPQAIEVTQLSLYLKLLEAETTGSTHQFTLEFAEALLPSLSSNIMRGNSLVSNDIGDLSQDDERQVRPFDIPHAFQRAFPSGRASDDLPVQAGLGPLFSTEDRGAKTKQQLPDGFDAIVGNPPYVLMQVLKQPSVFKYLSARFHSARYKIDTYHVFLEQALKHTKPSGFVGYITPNSYFRNKHAEQLRRYIMAVSEPQSIRLFDYPVFKGASVDTAVLITKKCPEPRSNFSIEVSRSASITAPDICSSVDSRLWKAHPKCEFSLSGSAQSTSIINKLAKNGVLLGTFATAYFGIQTHDRKRFVSSTKTDWKPVIDGGNIGRYDLRPNSEYVDFQPKAIKSGGNPEVYRQRRIGVRQIGQTPIATLIPNEIYTLNTIYNIFFTKKTNYSLEFVLGVILSKCIQYYWLQRNFDQKRTFPKIKKAALLGIPIPNLDFSKAAEVAKHDKIHALVVEVLESRRKAGAASTDSDKDYYISKASAAELKIDEQVNLLFELSREQIEVIRATLGAANTDHRAP